MRDIYMIWVYAPNDPSTVWLLDAWDAPSVEANHEGWRKVLEKARRDHRHDWVRVIKAPLDMSAVRRAWDTPTSTFGAVEGTSDA